METASVFQRRRTGVLLHITSLPSASLGEDAYRFVDFLSASGVSVWQMLPLGPTHSDGSPYQCLSAHAGNPELICFEAVKQEYWADSTLTVDLDYQKTLLMLYQLFDANANELDKESFNAFCSHQGYWLDDYVLFQELRALNENKAWFHWPLPLRQRETKQLSTFKTKCKKALNVRCFGEYLFFKQWADLKRYANDKGVLLFGDMPIFVAHDSADVWANPELFTLDENGESTLVAGVPPDYFSETGQRWGNPLYLWDKHLEQNFIWWKERVQTQLELFDLIRIDHFRGFEACWEIPASSETAIDGVWVKAPGDELFSALVDEFGPLPLVAEDLGIITDEVTALREKYAMPGMKILQFAFGDDASNPYLPHNHSIDSLSYTGTHDNNTTLGWFNELDDHSKARIYEYLGPTDEIMPWSLIRSSLATVSMLAIIPMQDILDLDGEHRMNVPGTIEGNWLWRFNWDMVDETCVPRLKKLNDLYGRSI
jgi:4-alpha-glucanotransferase